MKKTLIRQEILTAALEIATERGIDKKHVIDAMAEAFRKTAQSKYGQSVNIDAEIDEKTGEISLYQLKEVVASVEDPKTQIDLKDAQEVVPSLKLGDTYRELLPPIDFERIAAQQMRQIVLSLIGEAVRAREYEEFKDRVGEIVNGVVKVVDYGNVVLDLGKAEALLRRDEMIPREHFQPGDRARAYLKEIRQDPKGYQLFLSRTHPEFMRSLFMQEVPEVYSGVIEIKSVARDPGSRAKIGVYSQDPSIDPVGSCVGVRGSRVQAVTQELNGERIDVIHWSPDPLTFLVNAMTPAEITKVIMGEDEKRVEVVVQDEQLSLAIGRRGQNVRLASQLVGVHIDVLTESEELKRRTEHTEKLVKLFMGAFNVDDVMARLLASEGFENVEEIVETEVSDLENIEGFDESLAAELKNRGKAFLEQEYLRQRDAFREAGGDEKLGSLTGLPPKILPALTQGKILTLAQFSDLDVSELLEMGGDSLSEEKAGELIMTARTQTNEKQLGST